ncbi:hypothetical protein STRDD10_01215 [Streptococcus sp. DD10]|uniref:HEPN domain-containing protein n=1 Tax=Streptococcus sp. DD10 TaxID=1777878 RepID=UPI000797E601|nr:HEPN domain-containing protein [Streptococcus sp. DD10]KXT74057.1 hypothetical protein STRDD10_01215 [Streptococcus sp. DD10]
MKVDFELLLKPKTNDEDLCQLFWKSFENNREISQLEQTNTLACTFPEDNPLQFKTIIRKSDNILHCRLKAMVDVHWRKAYFYDKFRARISGILSQYFEVTQYSADLSAYYAKKCYSTLLDYETNLRKIFYFIYHFYDVTAATDERKKQTLNDYVEDLDLSQLEKFLFAKDWLAVGDSYEFCGISKNRNLYEKLQKLTEKIEFRSLWEINIKPLLPRHDIDEEVITKIRNVRNKVAHHKEMSFKDLQFCRNEVRTYANRFHEIQAELLERKFYQNTKVSTVALQGLLEMSKQFQKAVEAYTKTIPVHNAILLGEIIAKAMNSITIPRIDISKTIAPTMAEIANSHAERISKIMQNTTISQIGVLGNDEQESSSENDEEDKE